MSMNQFQTASTPAVQRLSIPTECDAGDEDAPFTDRALYPEALNLRCVFFGALAAAGWNAAPATPPSTAAGPAALPASPSSTTINDRTSKCLVLRVPAWASVHDVRAALEPWYAAQRSAAAASGLKLSLNGRTVPAFLVAQRRDARREPFFCEADFAVAARAIQERQERQRVGGGWQEVAPASTASPADPELARPASGAVSCAGAPPLPPDSVHADVLGNGTPLQTTRIVGSTGSGFNPNARATSTADLAAAARLAAADPDVVPLTLYVSEDPAMAQRLVDERGGAAAATPGSFNAVVNRDGSGGAGGGGVGSSGMPELPPELAEGMADYMASNPQIVDMIMNAQPEMRRMLRERPEMARQLRDRDFLRQMLRGQMDRFSRRAQHNEQSAAMSMIQNIPGGMEALERAVGPELLRGEVGGGENEDDEDQSQDDANSPNRRRDRPVDENVNLFGGSGNAHAAGALGSLGNLFGAGAAMPPPVGAGAAGGNPFAAMMQAFGGAAGGAGASPFTPPAAGGSGGVDPLLLAALLGGGSAGGAGGVPFQALGGSGQGSDYAQRQQQQMSNLFGAMAGRGSNDAAAAPPTAASAIGRNDGGGANIEAGLRVLTQEMGFEDVELCRLALEQAGGSVDAAVDLLNDWMN